MGEESFRAKLINQMKNSKMQGLPSSAQHYKEYTQPNQRRMQDSNVNDYKEQQKRSSGGDADRILYDSKYRAAPRNFESYRGGTHNHNGSYYLHRNVKPLDTEQPYNGATPKYHHLAGADYNIGGGDCHSGSSEESAKSYATIVSRKSAHELRKMVTSQCKLHDVIDETLKQMSSGEGDLGEQTTDEVGHRFKEETSIPMPPNNIPMHRNCHYDKVHSHISRKDAVTDIGKGDFHDFRSGNTITISVDDVVNSMVINPMIRKMQRMYLNNLKEEMSLMEDLERLPHKVNEVYQATIFKRKE